MNNKSFTKKIGGVEIKVTDTDLAENANKAILVEAEGTVVLVTAVLGKEDPTRDYFPLSVEFEERFYSVGRILGSRFMRREGRPSTESVLNARIIDRTIRPLFPKGFKREVQVIITVIAFGKYHPNLLGLLGASIAVNSSEIPWNGPVSAFQFTKVNNEWKPWAQFEEAKESKENLLICGRGDEINMIEMGGVEIEESKILDLTKQALEYIKELESFQKEIAGEIGKEKIKFSQNSVSQETKELFKENIHPHLSDAIFTDKLSIHELSGKWNEVVGEKVESNEKGLAKEYFEETVDTIIHNEVIDNNKRADGRKLDEVRTLSAEAGGISESLHGSGIFYRGGTHVLSVLTLGGPEDTLKINSIEETDGDHFFIHHYNFPPFSTGEVGRVGFTKRREIGHGALAEKALSQILPEKKDFPYVIRIVSEALSSNGSTSMGSVCASTIALMDGGVPIKSPVAGIAMGLIQRGEKYFILTDIQGPEDHYGDMDLKVAGTKNGITAMQMDVKIDGITISILEEALEKAKTARLQILDVILKAIDKPRTEICSTAPHLVNIKIQPSTIGAVIGSGGKTIKEIKEVSGVKEITIEDDGTVIISGDQESTNIARLKIEALTKTYEIGEEYDVKIVKLADFGAFVELDSGKSGLVHISEFAPERINSASDVVALGDVIPAVIIKIEGDKIGLSVKQRDPEFFKDLVSNISNTDFERPQRSDFRGSPRSNSERSPRSDFRGAPRSNSERPPRSNFRGSPRSDDRSPRSNFRGSPRSDDRSPRSDFKKPFNRE